MQKYVYFSKNKKSIERRIFIYLTFEIVKEIKKTRNAIASKY